MPKTPKKRPEPLRFPLPFVVRIKGAVVADFVYFQHAAYFAREIGGQVYKWAEDGCSLLPVG